MSSQKKSNKMFAEKLKELRENRQLLQRQVSAKLEIDNALYCKFESGSRIPRREQVIQLADLYNYDQEELLKLWLADKVYDLVGEEDNKDEVLNFVAENITEYERRK